MRVAVFSDIHGNLPALEAVLDDIHRQGVDPVRLPEFQHLVVGDTIPIANDPGWPVAAIEPERRLVLNIQRPRPSAHYLVVSAHSVAARGDSLGAPMSRARRTSACRGTTLSVPRRGGIPDDTQDAAGHQGPAERSASGCV